MRKLILTTIENTTIVIYVASNITFRYNQGGFVKVLDGLHNNGGWIVRNSLEDIERQLREPLYS